MGNNIIIADKQGPANHARQQLNLELAEIREISDLMFRKLEGKLREVQAVEASVDKKKAGLEQTLRELHERLAAGRELAEEIDRKIATLQLLQQNADSLQPQAEAANRQQEITALIRKGLASREIAEVLDMPQGEIELIAELNRHTS